MLSGGRGGGGEIATLSSLPLSNFRGQEDRSDLKSFSCADVQLKI